MQLGSSVPRRIRLVSLISLLVVLVGCAPAAAPTAAPAAPKAETAPLRISGVAPLGGSASPYGLSLQDGMQMGVEEVNATGGIMGRKVQVTLYDSQSTPANAATLAQKIVFEDKSPIVIGSSSSLDSLAMMEITENNKVPLYIPSAASPKITGQGYKWVWRQSITDGVTAKLFATYIAKSLKWQRVGTLFENTDYAKPPVQIMAEDLQKAGVQVVIQEALNVGDPDLSAQLLRIRDAKVDGLVVWAHYAEGALAVKQNAQLGLNLKLMVNQGNVFPQFLDLLDARLKQSSFIHSITSFVWTDDDPKRSAWAKKFKEKYGRDSDQSAMDAYDAPFVIKAAVEKAGSLEAAKIQAAFNSVKYEGIGGSLSFDSTGQARRSSLVVELKDGTFKVTGRVDPD